MARNSVASLDSGRVPRGARRRWISHHEIISRVRILMVASEVHPFAKTGGLADVLGALPLALAKLGHHVDVVMPRYRGVQAGSRIGQISVTLGGQVDVVDVSAVVDRGVRYVFIAHAAYFEREYLYGAASRDYPDNPERFAFLSQAALTWAASTGQPYDIVHAHDWQAGLVPLMVRRTVPAWRATAVPATVFTIHNLAYQGVFDASWLPRLGLGWDLMRVDALEYWNRISFLKGGIMFAGGDHDRQPAVRRGNPDPGTGLWIRRHPARALGRSGRHSQRNRLRSVGSRAGPEPSGALQRVKDGREGGGQAKGSRSVRIAREHRTRVDVRWWR